MKHGLAKLSTAPSIASGVPLVLGVTGHRDIVPADTDRLRLAFSGILRELSAAYPHTPILVLSPLASGADLLAAEEALAQGLQVIACLPMPASVYEDDFDGADLQRFRLVLAKCANVRVVAKPERRVEGYAAAGAYVAHYSNLLVAFWDGEASRGHGGTADVVRMRETGTTKEGAPQKRLLALHDVGPYYHIVTPREGGAPPVGAYAVHKVYPERFPGDEASRRDFTAALQALDVYNADVTPAPPPATMALDAEILMQRTDKAANKYQFQTNAWQSSMYWIVFIAATLQITQASDRIGTAIKVLAVGATAAVYLLARRNNYQKRYQDYRAIAEALRVHVAWRKAGIAEDVDRCYLKMQQSELQWIRMVLKAVALENVASAAGSDQRGEPSGVADWIGGQCDYYRRSSIREASRKQRYSLVRTVLGSLNLAGGTVIAAALAFGFPGLDHLLADEKQREILRGVLGLFIAWAALSVGLLSSYASARAFSENSKRYRQMYLVFEIARHSLRDNVDRAQESEQEIAREIGSEALTEHAEWLFTQREHPISMVA